MLAPLPPPPSHHHHHQPFCSLCYLFCVAFCGTLAVAMSDRDGGSSAWRRRQRRLRLMLRHERQTFAMELAAALHHSRDVGLGTNDGLRAQATASSGKRPGVLTEPEPQEGAVMVGYVAAPVPTLALYVLAGSAGEAVDDRSLRFLLGRSLAEKKEEEEKRRKAEFDRQVEEVRQASLARARELYGSKRAFLVPPFLVVAAHVVDNGSGVFLVLLVWFFTALWFLRSSTGLRCLTSCRYGPGGLLQWYLQGWCCWFRCSSRCVPFSGCQAPNSRHSGRYGPEGHLQWHGQCWFCW